MADDPAARDIQARLAAPFPLSEIQWKPGAVAGGRALALPYIDARTVEDRLDQVLGVEGWQDDYQLMGESAVVCRLRVRVAGEWICRTDAGALSSQADPGDRMKAAFSDALKRAAVKFGVGRYLYNLSGLWVDYDAKKKQLAATPPLPAWAMPMLAASELTEAQITDLEMLLQSRKKSRANAMAWLHLPGETTLRALTQEQHRQLVDALNKKGARAP